MSPSEHDLICALVSHLPHVLANAFVWSVYSRYPHINEFAGPSFRDFTRIAGSSPAVWLDIFLSNRQKILTEIDEFISKLELFRDLLQKEDEDALLSSLLQVQRIKEEGSRNA
ncbi:MAG: prephenate dehydrogenase dimerization domain-containing protein [Atribacterota bacterium]|nr:prephenate dehydrogenase/arogenate dehydrogenase family protein [Candidatus Atribacteria bacterium]